MIEIVAKTKKWGNSVGIILPKHLGAIPNKEIRVHIDLIKKPTRVGDIFGVIKFKKTTKQLMREIDKELDSE